MQKVAAKKTNQGDNNTFTKKFYFQNVQNKGIIAVVADIFIKNYAQMTTDDPAKFLYGTTKEAERVVDEYKKLTGINGDSTVVAVIVKDGKLNKVDRGKPIQLMRGDKILHCSDGVSNALEKDAVIMKLKNDALLPPKKWNTSFWLKIFPVKLI